MQEPETADIIKHGLAAFSGGLFGRLLMALHGGERRWAILLIESFVGGTIGFIAGAFLIYWATDFRDLGWGLYIVIGAASWAGAIGVKLLDIFLEAARAKLGLPAFPPKPNTTEDKEKRL